MSALAAELPIPPSPGDGLPETGPERPGHTGRPDGGTDSAGGNATENVTDSSNESSTDSADDRGDQADVPVLEDLVRACIAGEPGATDRLLARLQPLVLRYCRGRLGRQETAIGSADDIAQEVCLAVVTALPSYRLKGLSFRAFVYGIAAHKVTDAFRAIGRNRCDPVADLPDAPVVADGPEARLLARELTERLGGLLHVLTPRQREVLVLRIAVGLSAEETAAAVGSTPGAVRVTQHRALNRLRGALTDGRGPDGAVDAAGLAAVAELVHAR